MRWTHEGANALLHIYVADLNGELASALKRRDWKRPKTTYDPRRYWRMSGSAWVNRPGF